MASRRPRACLALSPLGSVVTEAQLEAIVIVLQSLPLAGGLLIVLRPMVLSICQAATAGAYGYRV